MEGGRSGEGVAGNGNGRSEEGEEEGGKEAGIDELDPKTKLRVARRFVESEANGKGTSQVVQRVCGMVVRGWTVR